MIKHLFQWLTGIKWGKYPEEYLTEDILFDCAVLVFAFLIFVRWS